MPGASARRGWSTGHGRDEAVVGAGAPNPAATQVPRVGSVLARDGANKRTLGTRTGRWRDFWGHLHHGVTRSVRSVTDFLTRG
jgi:hypothetical protein